MERNHLEYLGVGRRIILKRVFKNWYGDVWTRMIWLRTDTCGGGGVNAVMNFRVP
jgi:hypothetical protein